MTKLIGCVVFAHKPSSRGSATYEDGDGKGHRQHSIEINLHSHFVEEATKLETVYLETLKNADCPLLATTI